MASAGAQWHNRRNGMRYVQLAGETRQKAARRRR